MVLKLPCMYYFQLIICMIIIHAWSIHFMQAYTLAGLSGGFLTFFISMSMLLGRFVSSINRKQWSQQSPRWANSTVFIDSPSTIFHVINVIQSNTIVSHFKTNLYFGCSLEYVIIPALWGLSWFSISVYGHFELDIHLI